MKVENIMWWHYPPKALSLARKMRDERRHSWREIAAYLYRAEFPFFEPEMLRLAVLAADRGEDRPPVSSIGRRRQPTPPLPPKADLPRPPPATSPPDSTQLTEGYRAAWQERFPDKPWPGDTAAIRILMRDQRRGPSGSA